MTPNRSKRNANSWLLACVIAALVPSAIAQGGPPGGGGGGGRPEGGGGGGGGGGGRGGSVCPDVGQYGGSEEFMGEGPYPAPLLGNVGCVDNPGNTTNRRGEFIEFAKDIYGPFEAGFRASQIPCENPENKTVPGGLDTELAVRIMNLVCATDDIDFLANCGGHANFHYHERMDCLYEPDELTGHSTRIGTALDGNGIYGMYVDGGELPTDLDACGGRFGVTPDSMGMEVYYYPIKEQAPFTMACFGPVDSLQECRDLYERCGDDITEILTVDGTVEYDLWCPCFDSEGNNVVRIQDANINADGDTDVESPPDEEPTAPEVADDMSGGSAYMHIMTADHDGTACMAVRNAAAIADQTLVLAECGSTNDDGWMLDTTAGLVHSQLDDGYCMQAGRDGPPQEGGYIRLFPCDEENGYQKFVHDTAMSKNGDGHRTLRPLANQNLCLVWSGQSANVGNDLIVMMPCSEVEDRNDWQLV